VGEMGGPEHRPQQDHRLLHGHVTQPHHVSHTQVFPDAATELTSFRTSTRTLRSLLQFVCIFIFSVMQARFIEHRFTSREIDRHLLHGKQHQTARTVTQLCRLGAGQSAVRAAFRRGKTSESDSELEPTPCEQGHLLLRN
jgi:hypothetical protein